MKIALQFSTSLKPGSHVWSKRKHKHKRKNKEKEFLCEPGMLRLLHTCEQGFNGLLS